MKATQQKLHSLTVANLKNINSLDISFEPYNVTAILGPNGCGKSTILHALACTFKPSSAGDNKKFSYFFLPNSDSIWNGSKLTITHSYREGQNEYTNVEKEYKKSMDRWTPRYDNRPARDTYYIGIENYVPMIETETKKVRLNYLTSQADGKYSDAILECAAYIMNKRYSSYNKHYAQGKEFMGVEADGLKYSALSMSAGEQKVFYVLEKVFSAPDYSLILIDELDLLLHDLALKKLIAKISERAIKKKLQIIFTTHRENVAELQETINIRHIYDNEGHTICLNETKPDAIKRLTGKQIKPLEIFVEDDLAAKIAHKLAFQAGLGKYVSIDRYGAADNCFTLAAALVLRKETRNNSLFILDGDKFRTPTDKEARIKKALTGDTDFAIHEREIALSLITQFTLPESFNPEQYIHRLLINLSPPPYDKESIEIIQEAKKIHIHDDKHKFVNELISTFGWERNSGLTKLIDLIATSCGWDEYTQTVRTWLEERSSNILEK